MKSLKVSEEAWYSAKVQATKQKISLSKFVEKAIQSEIKKT